MAYLTVAWNRLHDLYSAPSAAFRSPYDQTLVPLFDNDHTVEQIFAELPSTLDELFTPEFRAYLAEPSGALRAALDHADSMCSWQPRVVTHLYGARGDRDVAIDNLYYCERELRGHAAAVETTDLGELDHGQSLVAALPQVLSQFAAD